MTIAPIHLPLSPRASTEVHGGDAGGAIDAGRRRADATPGACRSIGAPAPAPPPAPERVRAERRLIDSHGRTIRDVRISVTDRCNFRCVYCMEPDATFAPRESLLRPDEVARVARLVTALGARKIRITGGEPTLHPDIDQIIARVHSAAPSVEIAMITNGALLTCPKLRAWRQAGLARLTISIDSLRPERFAALSRSSVTPEAVLAGVEMALAEGLTPLKLNAVLLRGVNDDEAADLAALARRSGVEMRFIEYMPLDAGHGWDSSKWVSAAETRAAIEARFPLVPRGDDDPSSTSRNYRFADGCAGGVGFIAPVSSPFCGACSRLRITADGRVRPCLFSLTEWDLLGAMRSGADDEALSLRLIDAAWTKQPGHGIESPGFRQPDRGMSAIGG